jgi:hypothetical protein
LRHGTFYKGVVLGAATAAVVLAGAGAIAATGGNFILGQSNSATATSGLSANLASTPALDLANLAGGPAASFRTSTSAAPFTVSSKTKITSLNADMVDNKHASAFLSATGKAADSDKLDGLDSTAFLPVNGRAADSAKLNGLDPTAYQERVSGTCPALQAVTGINADGSVTCGQTGPSDAYTAFRASAAIGTINYQDPPKSVVIAHLDLPAGNFVVSAGAIVSSTSSDPVNCYLAPTGVVPPNTNPGSDPNVDAWEVQAHSQRATFEIAAQLADPGGADLVCVLSGATNSGTDHYANDIRITAISAGNLTSTVLP